MLHVFATDRWPSVIRKWLVLCSCPLAIKNVKVTRRCRTKSACCGPMPSCLIKELSYSPVRTTVGTNTVTEAFGFQSNHSSSVLAWTSIPNNWIEIQGSCGFAPWRVRPHRVHPHIDSTSDQVLKLCLSLTEKKRQHCARAHNKQNHTKHVYFSFFNPLKVTGELEIESLGWVHGGELSGGGLDIGRNKYHSCEYTRLAFATTGARRLYSQARRRQDVSIKMSTHFLCCL